MLFVQPDHGCQFDTPQIANVQRRRQGGSQRLDARNLVRPEVRQHLVAAGRRIAMPSAQDPAPPPIELGLRRAHQPQNRPLPAHPALGGVQQGRRISEAPEFGQNGEVSDVRDRQRRSTESHVPRRQTQVRGHALAVLDQQTIAWFVRRFVQLRLEIDSGQLGKHASQELLNGGMVTGRAGHHFDPRRKAPPQTGATRGVLRACESGGSHFQESFCGRSIRRGNHRPPAAESSLPVMTRIPPSR